MHRILSRSVLLSVLGSVCCSAATVSVNFAGNAGADGTLAATDVAGVVPVARWNNVTASGAALVDSTGTASGITVAFTVGGWSNQYIAPTTPNHRLMKGYLDIGGTGNTTVTLNGLDPAKTYKIYLYSDGENTSNGTPVSRTGRFTINGVATGITDTAGENFEGTFTSVYPGTTGEGDYVVVQVTGAASYTITAAGMAADSADNVYRASINGLQIVSDS